MGRRKIEIKCITNERNRSVTFLKRKNGLFKKAYELGVLCSVDVAVIIFGGPVGQKHKLYEYCSGDVDKIVKKRLNFNGDRDAKGPEDFGENKGKAEDGEDGEDDEVDDDSDAPAPAKPTKTKAKAAVPSKRAAPARPSSKRHQPKFDDDDDEALEPTPMDIEPPPPSRTPVIAAVAAAYARSLGNKAAAADGERYPSDHITHEPLPKRQRRDSTSTASSRDPYHHHSSPYHSLPSFGQSNDVGYPGGAYPGSSGTMPPPPPGSNSGHHHHHTHGYGASSYGATHAPDASLPALSLLRHPSVPNLSHYGSPYLGPSSHSHTHSGAPPRLGSGPPPPPMNVNINISRELMDAFALHQAQQGAGGPGIHSSSVAASAHTSGSHRSGPNGLGVHHPPPMSTGSTGFEWPSTTPQPPATPNLGSAGASGSGSGSGPAGDHDTSWLDIFSSSSGSSGAAPTERRESNTGSELMELFGNIASLGDLARSTVVGAVASGGADSGDRKRRFDSM